MRDYIVFRMNKRWLVGDPVRIVADTDDAAVMEARHMTQGCDVVELWQGNRLAAEIKPELH